MPPETTNAPVIDEILFVVLVTSILFVDKIASGVYGKSKLKLASSNDVCPEAVWNGIDPAWPPLKLVAVLTVNPDGFPQPKTPLTIAKIVPSPPIGNAAV